MARINGNTVILTNSTVVWNSVSASYGGGINGETVIPDQ